MLYVHSSIKNILEVLRILAEAIHRYNRVRMQARYIEQCYVTVHSRFRIYVTAETKIGSTVQITYCIIVKSFLIYLSVSRNIFGILFIVILPCSEKISRKYFREIRINKIRIALFAEYNSCGKAIRGVVDRHSSQVSQNLTSSEVTFQMVEYRFSRQHIVIAIFGCLIPQFFRNRLIPRKSKLLVMNTELDLPLFQRLFLRSKVVNISVREIIRFSEEYTSCAFLCVNDLLR